MNRLLIFASTLLVLAAFQSCKETRLEEVIPPPPAYCLEEGSEYLIPLVDSCRTQPFPRMGNIWTPPNEEPHLYFQPIVSTTNPNQIIYHRYQRDSSHNPHQLLTLDLCTGETVLLAEDFKAGFIQSMDGWILYSTDNRVIKIRTNGDSLTQLSNYFFPADWHPAGDRILGKMLDGNWAIFNTDGQLLQTLPSIRNYECPRWSPNGKYLAIQGAEDHVAYVYLFELATEQIEQIPVPTSASWHFWVDNDHLLIQDKNHTGNIVKMNIHTHQVVNTIQPYCVNTSYVPYSLSPDGQFLFCGYNIFEESTPGSSLLNRYTKLVVMNLDGSNEREIVVE